MLPAAHRLRSPRDFSTTTRAGRSSACGSVVAYVHLAPEAADGEPARVGLIVTRAVGGSVERHRVSRRLRAAVRPVVSTLPPGSTVVLRALPSAAGDPHLASSTVTAIGRALERSSR